MSSEVGKEGGALTSIGPDSVRPDSVRPDSVRPDSGRRDSGIKGAPHQRPLGKAGAAIA